MFSPTSDALEMPVVRSLKVGRLYFKAIASVLTFIYFFNFDAKAQSADFYDPAKVIPPSPTAASLGNYGNYNVGFYTGRPDIGIPLYEIKTANHSIPISLQYDASGVRVSQQASWVGLSWSLQAGGVITRTVRGLDDFGGNGYYIAEPLQDFPTWTNRTYFDQIAAGTMDAEADIFSYNLGPYSGKFVIGKKAAGGTVFMDQANNLQIKYLDVEQRWEVTDGKGYRYFLSTPEFVQECYNYSGPLELSDMAPLSNYDYSILPPPTTAWYLDSIASPSSELVKFTYESIALSSRSISLPQKSENEYNMIQESGVCSSVAPRFDAHFKNYSSSKQVTVDRYLMKILFAHGSVEFIRTDRNDIDFKGTEKPDKLSQILIKDLENHVLKQYTLHHSYFFDEANGRLKLDSLTEADAVGNTKPPYKFSYYSNNVAGPYTKSIDHWGFFNSKPNDKLIPQYYIEVAGSLKTYPGADRTPDLNIENATKGVLATITYPTGGATQFEYELHEYGRLKPQDSYRYEDASPLAVSANPTSLWQNATSDPVTFEYATEVELAYGYSLASSNAPNDPFTISNQYANIRHPNGSPVYLFDNMDCPGMSSPCSNVIRKVVLPAGTYVFSVNYNDGWETHMYVRWKNKIPVTTKKGGGIRIKSIENTINGTRAGIRTFIYNHNIYGGTTGQLITDPTFAYVFELVDIPNRAECTTYNALYLGRSSSSVLGSGLATASTTVGYDIVTELIGENGEEGKIEHTFMNLPEVGTSHPYISGYVSPLSGKPYQTVTYDAQGNELTKTEYRYEMRTSIPLRSIKLYQATYGNITSDYFIQSYYDYADCLLQTSEKKTDFGDSHPLTTEQLFFYENPEHNLVTAIKSTRTDGSTQVTKFKYPGDYTEAGTASFVYQMKQRNIVTPVIEEQTLISKDGVDRLLSGTFTKYKMINAGHFVPESISKIETNSLLTDITVSTISGTNQLTLHPNYKEEVFFDTYTPAGNLETFHKSGGAYESYLWDYQSSLPVAHTINAAAADVAYTSFESLGKGGWEYIGSVSSGVGSNPPSGTRYYNLTNSTPLDKAVTANAEYVISYWSSNGNPYTIAGGNTTAPLKTGASISGWTYFEHTVKATTDVMSIQGSGSIDEVRLRPFSSQMSTYTYDPLVGLTSSTDTNGVTSYFNYDGFQRLHFIKDQHGNIVKSYQYRYHSSQP